MGAVRRESCCCCLKGLCINLNKENKILILGSGAIGLLISSIIKIHSGIEVTIIDCLKYRLNNAKKYFKSDYIINSNLKASAKNLFDKFDVVFDCITNNDSINLSIQAFLEKLALA